MRCGVEGGEGGGGVGGGRGEGAVEAENGKERGGGRVRCIGGPGVRRAGVVARA